MRPRDAVREQRGPEVAAAQPGGPSPRRPPTACVARRRRRSHWATPPLCTGPGTAGRSGPCRGPPRPLSAQLCHAPSPVPRGRAACRAAAATHGHTRCPPGPRRRLACAGSACATGRAGEAPGDPGEALRDKLRRLPTAGGGGPAGSWGAVGLHGCSAARGRQEETGWPGPLGTIARGRPCASPLRHGQGRGRVTASGFVAASRGFSAALGRGPEAPSWAQAAPPHGRHARGCPARSAGALTARPAPRGRVIASHVAATRAARSDS